MNANIVTLLSEHPIYFWNLIAESLPTALLVYAIVWAALRPRRADGSARATVRPGLIWHGIGVAVAVLGAILLRLVAAATFAGRSAIDTPVGALTAGIEIVGLPALLSAIYILWLRSRVRRSTH